MSDHNYDDIIDLPHPTSRRYPRMTMASRAAQFAPFAALTGLSSAIQRVAEHPEEPIYFDDNDMMDEEGYHE